MDALGALRFVLKALNAAMLFLGVAVLTYSGVMWEQYESGGGGAPPAPVPPGTGAARAKQPAPWFVYAAAAVGVLLASTGATGMAGATAHSPRCCMTAHTAQMLLLLAFEAALLVGLCVDPALTQLPADATGREAELAAFVRAHVPTTRALLAIALALTAAVALLGLVLAALTRADEDSDDEEDGLASPRVARRRIMLSGEARLARGGVSERLLPPEPREELAGSYTQRMRERYTGDTPPTLRGSPARPRRLTPEALLGDPPARPRPDDDAASSCALM